MAAIAWVTGMLPILFLPQLPSQQLWVCLVLITLLLCWQKQYRGCQWLCFLLVGFIFATGSARILMQQVEMLVTGGDKSIIASVHSVRLEGAGKAQTQFQLEQIDGHWLVPSLRFTANTPSGSFCAGQRVAMKVRFRQVHSNLNEGGFDGQRWAMANRQPLNAYIHSAVVMKETCHWRQQIITYIDQQLLLFEQRPILLALAFGERSLIDSDKRTRLVKTGVAHLMAISGLHISLAVAFAWGMARAAQYLLPARYISYRLPLMAGWVMALCYVWLAGGQLPAMRAFIALSLWLWLRFKGISCSAWQVWLWCISLLLLFEPLSVLSDSFWLSVLAVAALIFWFEWVPLPVKFTSFWGWLPICWLHIQLGMTLLLMPLQFALFHGVNWVSLPANLWAVPVVSFLSVPLILLAMLLFFIPPLSLWCWKMADLTLSLALWPLSWLEQGWLPVGAGGLQFSLLGWLLVICWRFAWWRFFPAGCITVLLSCWLFRDRQPDYNWRVDMLDVGHGLSVVIEREGKAVIYDSGGQGLTSSAAERFILPFLRWRQISLEHILISHSHLDHVGGLAVLERAFPQAKVHTPFINERHLPCIRGQHWAWQGLNFKILWPPAPVEQAGNDDSCVVRVDDGRFSILLTGDIENRAEQALLRQRIGLAATILQVPHHGSRTSSSPPLLRAVAPELAIASVARYNPWRLPAEKVTDLYRQNHIKWRDTAHSGQLSVFFFDQHWQIKGFREQLHRRWWATRVEKARDDVN